MPKFKSTHKDARRVLQERVTESGTRGGSSYQSVSWKTIGHEYGDVEIIVDTDAIFNQCGYRALVNKGGQSKFMHGAVTVRLVGVRRRVPLKTEG